MRKKAIYWILWVGEELDIVMEVATGKKVSSEIEEIINNIKKSCKGQRRLSL